MNENKDLGGKLNANDMDRIFDDSVSVTVPFSVKRSENEDKTAAIKGNLEFNFQGYSQRLALNKACQQLRVDWANGIRVKGAWVGVVPKDGQTIKIKVSEYFSSRVKAAPVTPAALLALFGGDVEALKTAIDAAAKDVIEKEKESGLVHVDPEEHEKFLAEKREKYLKDEEEKQAELQAKMEEDRKAEEESVEKRKTAKEVEEDK